MGIGSEGKDTGFTITQEELDSLNVDNLDPLADFVSANKVDVRNALDSRTFNLLREQTENTIKRLSLELESLVDMRDIYIVQGTLKAYRSTLMFFTNIEELLKEK